MQEEGLYLRLQVHFGGGLMIGHCLPIFSHDRSSTALVALVKCV